MYVETRISNEPRLLICLLYLRNALISLRSAVKQEEEEDASGAGCCERAQDSWTVRWIRGKKNTINTVQFLAQTDRFVS